MRKRGATFKRSNPLARFGISEDQQRDIGLASHISFQAMLSGNGTEQTWSTVVCSLNTALLLAEQGFSPASIETIKLAQEAMLRSQERSMRTGKWALDGEGIRVIEAALNIHDEQLSRCTRGKITDALREVHRRIEDGEVFTMEQAPA